MDNYVAVASPAAGEAPQTNGANTSHANDTTAQAPQQQQHKERRRASASSCFGLRDDSESVSGDAVDDPDLEAATNQVDVSTRFLCISSDAVEKYLPVVVSISMGAYFGVGTRMLLTEFANALSYERGALLQMLGGSFFLPNAFGCFVMGFCVRCKPLLRERFSVYLTGVTTGFCGCCTTFASWDIAIAASFVHGNWVTALLLVGVQVASAFVSFRSGLHVAESLIAYLCTQSNWTFDKPPVDAKTLHAQLEQSAAAFDAIRVHNFADGVTRRMATTRDALVSARDASSDFATEIAHEELAQPPHTHKIRLWRVVAVILLLWLWIPPFLGLGNYPCSRLFGLALGPFGALLRYYLSLFNSQPQCKDFPRYTFLANVTASVLSCLLLMIGSATNDHSGRAYRAYVFLGEGGLLVGFCGSLSTVSTWINEIDALASRNMYAAYRYALVSIVVSQGASILLLGVYVLAASSSAPLLA